MSKAMISANSLPETDGRPFYIRQGWVKKTANRWTLFGTIPHVEYHGYYRTQKMVYVGKVEDYGDRLEFYVKEPPRSIRKLTAPHAICFQNQGEWYWIHLNSPEKYIGHGIFSIQRILDYAERA